jgi:hypothetical protein
MRVEFPPPDNPSSWAHVFEIIDEYPHTEYWRAYKANVKEVLDRCIAENLHEDFRAGTSLNDIVFSTALKHGLKRGEPQVAFSYTPKKEEFYIAYATRALIWGDPISLETISGVEGAHALLKQYLLRLWKETKPELPIPPELLSSKL